MKRYFLSFFFLLIFTLAFSIPEKVSARPEMYQITSASQLIEAVNSLRASYGLLPLTVHPILMQSAQSQADYMAATGIVTHSRPGGVTYTQQLLSLGFPLAGDLSLGGFRSENIINSNGPLEWNGVPGAWQDSQHMNTMLSQNFSHIGAGVSQSGDQYYYAVDTAAATGSGQMQESASNVLTSVPGGASGEAAGVSQYMVPVTISTPRPDGNVYHKVQYGQSLWSIAIAYGTTIKTIQALNNLGEDLTVYQGQELLVQTGATQAATVPPESTPTLSITATFPPTATLMSTSTPVLAASPTSTEAEKTDPTKPVSSRILVTVLILAAFIGAGMAVWLIRDPS